MAPGWRIDELANAGRENLDPEHAARYDGKMDAAAAGEVAWLRELGAVGPGSTVVDLGTGTGQFAVAAAAAEPTARVVAVDVSPVMLGRLEAKLAGAGAGAGAGAAGVEAVRAGFLGYEHAGPPADLVYSRFALHHLPDFWKVEALRRIHAVLRPGGWFRLWDVIYDCEPSEAATVIEAWCATGAPGWERWELEEHVRDEHSTYRWLLEPMLERCGFALEEVAYSPDRMEGRYLLRTTGRPPDAEGGVAGSLPPRLPRRGSGLGV